MALPGTRWATGLNGTVYAIAAGTGGSLYVGGYFTVAGGQPAGGIARWQGGTWSHLGAGTSNANGTSGSILALTQDGSGGLYAGGSFANAGPVAANSVARWNGTSWSALGSGVNGAVRAMAVDGQGNLYAGGLFTTAGGQPASRVARWDGTGWSPLGSGVNGQVNALAVDVAGNLYVGGSFTTAGGVAAKGIARWNGATWSAVGAGVARTGVTTSGVNALTISADGLLYVGGDFNTAGGVAANNVARWNGTAWSALGTGIGLSIDALALDGSGTLFAGGNFFLQVGGQTIKNLLQWDGSSWGDAGSGLSRAGGVAALLPNGARGVVAGGRFLATGDDSKVSAYLGIYTPQQALATAPAALTQQVGLYPNPATSSATIELPAAWGRQAVTATLADASDHVVRVVTLPAQGAVAHTLNLRGLPPGVYLLRLATPATITIKKLLVE